MPESNAELARRGFEAVANADWAVVEALLDPDVRWHGGEPGPQSCFSSEQVLQFMRQTHIRGMVGQLEQVIEFGDKVVVVVRLPTVEDSDKPELRANLTTFREGKVVEMVAYVTPAAAMQAARA